MQDCRWLDIEQSEQNFVRLEYDPDLTTSIYKPKSLHMAKSSKQ